MGHGGLPVVIFVVGTVGHFEVSRSSFFLLSDSCLLHETQTAFDRFLGRVTLANPTSHSRHLPASPQLLQLTGHSFFFGLLLPPLPFPTPTFLPGLRSFLDSAVTSNTTAITNKISQMFFMIKELALSSSKTTN